MCIEKRGEAQKLPSRLHVELATTTAAQPRERHDASPPETKQQPTG
jgi:hypothetical protein